MLVKIIKEQKQLTHTQMSVSLKKISDWEMVRLLSNLFLIMISVYQLQEVEKLIRLGHIKIAVLNLDRLFKSKQWWTSKEKSHLEENQRIPIHIREMTQDQDLVAQDQAKSYKKVNIIHMVHLLLWNLANHH